MIRLKAAPILGLALSAAVPLLAHTRPVHGQSGQSIAAVDSARINLMSYIWPAARMRTPERNLTSDERRAFGSEFLVRLQHARTIAPDNDWVVGQLVDLLVQMDKLDEATRVAFDCAAAEWWCLELQGYVLHLANRFASSEIKYDSSLAVMPAAVLCRRTRLTRLLPAKLASSYDRLECDERRDLERRIWWLSNPLYSQPGNDRYTEHRSRLLLQQFHDQSHAVWAESSVPCKPSHRSELERLGWPDSWWALYGIFEAEPPRGVGYSFVPVMDNLAGGYGTTWELDRDNELYQPAYGRFVELGYQIAVLQRNGVGMAVAATDLRETSFAGLGAVRTALVLARDENDPPVMVLDSGSNRVYRFQGRMSADTVVASVEAIQAAGGAGRARVFIARPQLSRDGYGLSDLLLFDWNDELDESFDAVFEHMLGTTRLAADAEVGIFWELYGAAKDVPITVGIEAVPQDQSLLRRLGSALGLARRETLVRFSWSETGEGREVAGRTLRLDLSRLPPGAYNLRLTVQAAGRPSAVAERTIELFSPDPRQIPSPQR